MPAALQRLPVLLLVFAIGLAFVAPAPAQIAGVRKAKAIPVILGVVAAGVLIGYGVYLAVHHGHSLKGCASGSPGDVRLLNEGDQEMYALSGDLQGIKTGNLIRVSGSKGKPAGSVRSFAVARLSKDYGACKIQP